MTALLASAVLGISGSYFESRTCAIYAGPCHFSGEVMVDGGTALLAWAFETGSYDGVSLAGLSVSAVVSAERNFAFTSPRKSLVILPKNATAGQRAAIMMLIERSTDIGTVAFRTVGETQLKDGSVTVIADGSSVFEATTSNRECRVCSMPGELWYEPLSTGVQAKTATVERQALYNGVLGETWVRKDEPAAFVGRFAW